MSDWMLNDDGYWCPSCGELIARPETAQAGFLPEECRECGFPDDVLVAAYHTGAGTCDDFDEDEDEDYIDCGLGPDGQCSQAGSEYCDWTCGRLG